MNQHTPGVIPSSAEEDEDISSNPSTSDTLGDMIAARFSRRDLARGLLAVSAMAATVSPLALLAAGEARAQLANAPSTNPTPSFDFKEVSGGSNETSHVAEGYDADILIRWGDKVTSDAPPFEPQMQSSAAQEKQFGYNSDFLGYIPLEGSSEHGLLVVNHEYTNTELMFPGVGRPANNPFAMMTEEFAAVERMAHGGAVLEVRKTAGKWSVVAGSRYNRRITVETDMRISGPAAGHELMRTKADPTGGWVRGMLNNCAGGLTPWGTWLTCEENINTYFSGNAEGHPEPKALKRYGMPSNRYSWGKYVERFDVSKEPNESNRFGWVVEIDPLDPASVPVKRTALGRFKHEGAGNVVNRDGRFVVYSGDDQQFDYVYKFVTQGIVDRSNRAHNRDLLDRGTLYVAKFSADGAGEWLPLVHGDGKLTAASGFKDQGHVLVHARLAADVLGATRMDRPEDIEVNAKSNKVYVILTNNTTRKADQVDAANPRAENRFGHIIELTPEDGDHAATKFRWEILLKCGDPSVAAIGSTFNPSTSKDGWFGMPDNALVDAAGRLWIATDGNSQRSTGREDGLWALETDGAARGTAKLFFRCPVGAELCGPEMTPDMATLFVAVQHPAEGNGPNGLSTFDAPTTRWPDFKPDMPPRPSIVAITRRGGGRIG